MSVNSLGTLTLDLVAKIGGFVEPLSRAERMAKKTFDSIGASMDSLESGSTNATKAMERLAKQMDDQFNNIGSNMAKEIALYGETTRVAKLRYEVERGELKLLNAEQKASLMDMARRLDAMDDANAAFNKQSKELGNLNKSYRGARGFAQQFGWQMQDVAVQMQMGTDAFIVFSQQGSQLASAFSPMLGLVIALAGVAGGLLFKSMMSTSDAMKNMAENVNSLNGELTELTYAQQELVKTASGYVAEDIVSKFNEQTEAIKKQKDSIAELNAEHGRRRFDVWAEDASSAYESVSSKIKELAEENQGWIDAASKGFISLIAYAGGAAKAYGEGANDSTEAIAEAEKKIAALEVERIKTLKELEKLQDPSKSNDKIKKLAEEYNIVGLTGKAYWEMKAAQEGLIGLNKQLYIDLNLRLEQKNKEIELEKKLQKEKEEAAKKAEEDAKRQAEKIQKMIQQMQREVDLQKLIAEGSDKVSRAAQMEYDIKNGLIDIVGGLESAEAKRLISLAKQQDFNESEKERGKNIDDIVKKLKEEADQVTKTRKEYVAMQLTALGAEQSTIDAAMADIDRAEKAKDAIKEQQDFAKRTEEMWNRIDEAAANAWEGVLSGADDAFSGIKNIFRKTLAEMAHDALTKPILMQVKDTISPWLDQFKKGLGGMGGGQQQGGSGGKGGGAAGLLGGLGVWGIAAVGIAAAVSSFNKKQDEIARKMSAEYRQSTQSLGTILGESGKKSESIANSISILADYADDTLSVNHQMYLALQSIDAGINGVAAGFARQFGLKGVGSFSDGISTGTYATMGNFADKYDLGLNLAEQIGEVFKGFAPLANFVEGLFGKINKELFKTSKKIIDSGIGFVGQTLADILATGTIEAFGYAEVQTKKKAIGITYSNSVKTQRQELDNVLLEQFSDVFTSAGEALEKVAPVFGKDFSQIIGSLKIDTKNLSLKDLEGDALVKEIEAFFSSTLDNWAGVLVGGTQVLEKFQKVGEGAFETVIRLASETLHFTEMMDALDISFNLSGVAAIEASQAIASAAGGFDNLAKSLSSYYKEFYSESEQAAAQSKQLAARLKELGIDVLPATRDAFRDLVEAQNLSTEAGQKQFAALIGLSGAVDQYIESLEDETKAREEAQQKLKDAVGKAFESFSSAIERDMKVVEDALDSSRDLANSVTGAVKSMRLESAKSDLMTRRAAQAQVVSATAIARAGGPMPTSASLESALSVLSQPSQDLFSSFEEYARDFYQTQNTLKDLESQANSQVSIDEKNLEALQKSLDYYQQQVDLLNGIDKGIITVGEAMNRLVGAFANAGVIVPMVSSPSAPVAPRIAPEVTVSSADAEQSVSQSLPGIVQLLQQFIEDMGDSQYAIAKNTLDTKKYLERWDTDGMPLERTDA